MRDDGPCCPADAARRTSRIWVAGNNVGIIELERIFEEVYRMDLEEDDAITDALVERARIYNFIPPQALDDYRVGSLKKFRKKHPSEVI